MHSLKRKLQKLARIGLAGVGLLGGLKAGTNLSDTFHQISREKQLMSQPVNDVRSLIDKTLPMDEQEKLVQLISLAEEIPSGRQILNSISQHGTALTIDELGDRIGGGTDPDLSKITLNRAYLGDLLKIFGAFIHEGEHVRTLGNDHENGITLKSFASEDDEHMWETVRESLATRKAYMALCEVIKIHPELDKDQKLMKEIRGQGGEVNYVQWAFDARMSGDLLDYYARRVYEEAVTRGGIKKGENILNLKQLPQNPDWNRLVRMSSGGEVKSVNAYPFPTMNMVNDLISHEIYTGLLFSEKIDVTKIDLTCVRENKDRILKGNVFRRSVCHLLAKEAFAVLQVVKDGEKLNPWLDELRSVMPEASVQKLMSEKDSKCWGLPEGFWDESLETFLTQQNSFDYLKKAQKVLNSPKLKAGYLDTLNDPVFSIERGKEVLKAYRQIFFGEEDQKKRSNARVALLKNVQVKNKDHREL